MHKISILAHHMKTGVIAIVSSQLEKLIKVLVFFIVVEEAGERAKVIGKTYMFRAAKRESSKNPDTLAQNDRARSQGKG